MSLAQLPEGADAPFVLLDDASADGAGRSMLFRDPVEIVEADRLDDVLPALARIEAATQGGLHAAGYLSYAAGHAFEPRLARFQPREGDAGPLLWFGLFRDGQSLAPDAVPDLLPAPDRDAVGLVEPLVSRADYDTAIGKVLDSVPATSIRRT
jgi:hypothetical protein